jgi:shikimate dehydrogenase
MSYERLLAPVDGFVNTVDAFRKSGARGTNVTLPFKLDAFNYANDLSARAHAAGAVNTLTFSGGRIRGDNTDGVGVCRDIVENLLAPLGGARILLVGAGGAARGVIGPILDARPKQLCIVNRTMSKAADLANHFRKLGPVVAMAIDDPAARHFDIVINATSASLGNTLPAMPANGFAVGGLAYDMVYGKGVTPFMAEAARAGARTSDGLGMLVEQAAEAFYIWRAVRPATAEVIEAMRAKKQSSLPE